MLEQKMFWYSLQAGSLAGWTFNAIGVIRPYNNKAIRRIWQMAMPLWALLHPVEIP